MLQTETPSTRRFWRWSVRYTLGPVERPVKYSVGSPPSPLQDAGFTFYLPAVGQSWRWGAYSCNGYSQSAPSWLLGQLAAVDCGLACL